MEMLSSSSSSASKSTLRMRNSKKHECYYVYENQFFPVIEKRTIINHIEERWWLDLQFLPARTSYLETAPRYWKRGMSGSCEIRAVLEDERVNSSCGASIRTILAVNNVF